MEFFLRILAVGLCAFMVACSGLPTHPAAPESSADTAVAVVQQRPKTWSSAWQHYTLPGKESTEYSPARLDGRDVMAAHAASSASL